MQQRFLPPILAAAFFSAASTVAAAATPLSVPLTANHWQGTGTAVFIQREGFPYGIAQVTSESEEGFVALKNQRFDDGTIEFDIKAVGEEMPGIRFHQQGDDTADMLYIRVGPNCPAAQDCLQYLPILHGRILWDVYPQYQAPAPFRVTEWNHIRLVISGERMNVYVNRQTEPSLRIAHLESGERTGTIALEGTALFANLTLAPGITDGLDPRAPADAAAHDHRFLVHWHAADPMSMESTAHLGLANVPGSSAPWSPIAADYGGLINLSRYHAPTSRHAPPQVVWLRTTLQSDREQVTHVAVGWLREIWIFANGKPVYAGKNLYNVKGGRRAPDGRLSLENGGFDLPLHKGTNDILVAIDGNTPDMRGRYGWGFMARLDRAEGVTQK